MSSLSHMLRYNRSTDIFPVSNHGYHDPYIWACNLPFPSNLFFGEIMFSWLDARDAQMLGVSLAEFFMKKIPLDAPNKKSNSIKKKQEVLDTMFSQVHQFKLKHTLNIYQKAKLGNTFKWKLLDAHYDPELVDELTKALLLKC